MYKEKPYEIIINVIPENSISETTFYQLENIFEESLKAIDKMDLNKKWKARMHKSEKVFLCLKALLEENLK